MPVIFYYHDGRNPLIVVLFFILVSHNQELIFNPDALGGFAPAAWAFPNCDNSFKAGLIGKMNVIQKNSERDKYRYNHHQYPEDREEDPDLHRRVLDLHDGCDDLVQLGKRYRGGSDPLLLRLALCDLFGNLLRLLLGGLPPVVDAVEAEDDPNGDHEYRDTKPDQLTQRHIPTPVSTLWRGRYLMLAIRFRRRQ